MYDTLIGILCEFKVNHSNISGFAFGFGSVFWFLLFWGESVWFFCLSCRVLFLFATMTVLLGRLYFCVIMKDKLLLFLSMSVYHNYVTTHDRN